MGAEKPLKVDRPVGKEEEELMDIMHILGYLCIGLIVLVIAMLSPIHGILIGGFLAIWFLAHIIIQGGS